MQLDLGAASDIPPNHSREFNVNGRAIGVWNVEGTLYAMDPVCPHEFGPLAAGETEDAVVTCPMHAWRFNVATGKAVSPYTAPNLTCYPVEVIEGRVIVTLPDGDS